MNARLYYDRDYPFPWSVVEWWEGEGWTTFRRRDTPEEAIAILRDMGYIERAR